MLALFVPESAWRLVLRRVSLCILLGFMTLTTFGSAQADPSSSSERDAYLQLALQVPESLSLRFRRAEGQLISMQGDSVLLRLSDGEQQAFDRGLVYEARMRGELHSNESSPFSVETSRRLMVDQAAFFLT